jgi:oxygen-independent coproporphyrinogen-3 oxidase
VANYVHYLASEKNLYRTYLKQALGTLYFGGGTPSLLSPQQINSICEGLLFAKNAEITLEINPLQISKSYLEGLKTTKVNRLSLGLQSMNDAELKWLERRHQAREIKSKIKLLQEFGYSNYSLDLMYGLPGSTTASVKANLFAYLELAPTHVSSYLLTLDQDCAYRAKLPTLPDDDLAADQYEMIVNTLCSNGFHHYEISNFALPGYEAAHNLAYWQSHDYLALGASASGFLDRIRYTNPANLTEYYDYVKRGKCFPNGINCDAKRLREDYLMMGLRLTEGIDEEDFFNRFGLRIESLYAEKMERLLKQGLLKRGSGRLAISETALFISSGVIGELIL